MCIRDSRGPFGYADSNGHDDAHTQCHAHRLTHGDSHVGTVTDNHGYTHPGGHGHTNSRSAGGVYILSLIHIL